MQFSSTTRKMSAVSVEDLVLLVLLLTSDCLIFICIPQAASQVGDLPVQTESSLVMISEPANRLLLTKEILHFCGALPIDNTEQIKVDPSNGNGTASKYINFVVIQLEDRISYWLKKGGESKTTHSFVLVNQPVAKNDITHYHLAKTT